MGDVMETNIAYSAKDAADLIFSHTVELAKIARTAGLDSLGHILEMAHLEARQISEPVKTAKRAA